MVSEVQAEVDGAQGRAWRERHGWELELAAGRGRLDVPVARELLAALVDGIRGAGGGVARWRVPTATTEHARAASDAGFDGRRRLVRLDRPLPAPPPEPALATRPFVPGADDDEWLRVNRAAFHWHPEQGIWTHEELRARIAEPWFDPEGFLLHPDGPPGSPVHGFCWTKVHDDVDPAVGEIFVIAVDPERAGSGLGRRLVLAGLAHLAGAGLGHAMLYTERDNAPAMALYESLGFSLHHEVQVFTRDVTR
ncbi:mycothiol synthase [Actinomarinicola tropica]|uniref:Mycothiol synthase n=1 Tax=Actinomarinicola tropica TaxID=2789776 RepID=A0A5Q2RJ17_9ACTN|nr:mycothiol synthase [Actinomarinicola tropica]QGG95514.1 mycothiol synthase [Actinomarinicola tropica]